MVKGKNVCSRDALTK